MQQAILWGWLGAWAVVWASAAVLGHPRVPERYARLHVGLLGLPIAASLMGVVAARSATEVGPWRADALGWLMALYVSVLSGTIQRFSLRYLHGDRAYRLYFLLLTWTTGAASVTWMSDDLRAFSLSWALMGFGLAGLAALKNEWAPAKSVAAQMGKCFVASGLAVGIASLWLGNATGSWRLSAALAHVDQLGGWEKSGMSGLLLLAAIIPAGQWPFHRWLLESAVTPTPVSAVMHAGLVNAGGLLLARVSPLFDTSGIGLHVALLVLAGLSVLTGTGISLVHVDYKRQLMASTMAQMGLMLIQCALGAYAAAVVHLVLHGLFKATLFLQSGSVVPRPEKQVVPVAIASRAHLALGGALGVVLGGAFWAAAPGEPARLLSALFLGAAVMLAWGYLPVFREGRWLGFVALALMTFVSEGIRTWLTAFLRDALPSASSPPVAVEVLAFVLFASGTLALTLLTIRRSSKGFARVYMALVHLGEPRLAAVERHPHYLTEYVKEGSLR